MPRAATPPDLRRFAMLRGDVEAVLQRCGLNTFDLILIDAEGNWTRSVFPSEDVTRGVAADLGVRLHDGWDPRMVKRMNRRDHWNEPGGQRRAQ